MEKKLKENLQTVLAKRTKYLRKTSGVDIQGA